MLGQPPSLAAYFDQWRKNRGFFLRFEGESGAVRVTWAQAAEAATAFALRLRASGIAKGERVIFWGENRPEWILALWGCLLEGVVAVPIDFRSSAAIVERIASIVRPRALLIDDEREAPAGAACPVWRMRDLIGGKAPATQFAPAEPDSVAEILFTSGATGEPKGVQLTHRNILANLKPIDKEIDKYRKYMGPFVPIRFLNLLPLSHMFGQSMAAFIPPMIAGEVWFSSGYSPADVIRLIHRRRISVLVSVPRMLELLRDSLVHSVPESAKPAKYRKWYLSWWQFRRVHRRFGWKFWAFIAGAAPLDPELEKFWRKPGYVVIQGYGLTETAPIATLNHPFHVKAGSVGKPIGGVEIRIADDGEILLRGENVTPGYFGDDSADLRDSEGWLHTGDIGQLDADRQLRILGRKKEMILSPEGLNVFPEDVERALNGVQGVRESAVVGKTVDSREEVHAALVLEPDAHAENVVRAANDRLEPHQRIRSFTVWPEPALPRTSGTGKLKRVEIAKRVSGSAPAPVPMGDSIADVVKRFAGDRSVDASTSLNDLGLSSLDRIQLMMAIEQRTGSAINETQFAKASTVGDLARVQPAVEEPFEFPEWNRSAPAYWLRRIALPFLILPLLRAFAWIKAEGLGNLRGIEPPVIFASNHQSHFDAPSILAALPAKWRYRVAPAMAKEFFDAHFHPAGYPRAKRFTNGLNYGLAALIFNAFPLPQRESGAREALRYAADLASDGGCILIFPEGKRTDAGELLPFQPGVGMLASRLHIPVVPVRLEGLERVLHKSARFPTPGRARVKFGPPLHLEGDDYAALAHRIQDAVARL